MKPVAFEYCQPETLDEALALLAEFGEDACILAGGLSLAAMLNMRLVRPTAVIDVNRVPDLAAIEIGDTSVRTGALVRQADFMASIIAMEALPLLALALPHVGHYQTRSRGTVGGSVAHADPSAEIPLSLLVLGGEVLLRSRKKKRRISSTEFFQGLLTTARAPDEMVTALVWPRHETSDGYAFDEIAQRHGDFAITAAASRARVDANGNIVELALAFGGVEDRPVLAECGAYIGAPATAETARDAAERASAVVEPVEDLQANADYRRQLVRVLGAKVITAAMGVGG